MAMVMMMTMPKMTMAKPVVPVMAVATVTAMATVTMTASESLTRDSQRSRAQCQSSNRGRNDRLDLRHGGLLVGQSEDRPAMFHP